MSLFTAALPHWAGLPVPSARKPAFKSPALMESPTISRKRALGGGGIMKSTSAVKAATERLNCGVQPLRRDSVKRVNSKVVGEVKLQRGSHLAPLLEKST